MCCTDVHTYVPTYILCIYIRMYCMTVCMLLTMWSLGVQVVKRYNKYEKERQELIRGGNVWCDKSIYIRVHTCVFVCTEIKNIML